jgi:hypothetical protein
VNGVDPEKCDVMDPDQTFHFEAVPDPAYYLRTRTSIQLSYVFICLFSDN